MCLKETCSTVCTEEDVMHFPIQNSPKQGDALSPSHFRFALKYADQDSPRKSETFGTEWNIPATVYANVTTFGKNINTKRKTQRHCYWLVERLV
jgi:hypothetical protein